MKWEPEFKGYWSDKDREIWENTDWKARDYKQLEVEGDTVEGILTFYSFKGKVQKKATFIKVLSANPIYPPSYEPIFTPELETFRRQGHYVGAMYDSVDCGQYHMMTRMETQEMYDRMST